MPTLLPKLLSCGLVHGLDGDDVKFGKIDDACAALAQWFQEAPERLIGGVLAGLDPEVPADDPAIAQAERALHAEWRSVSSVYPDPPIKILRAMVLEACFRSAEDERAAIVWLTAVDMVPIAQLGPERVVVAEALEELAEVTESLAVVRMASAEQETNSKTLSPARVPKGTPLAVDRAALQQKILAATGPTQGGGAIAGANPHWPAKNEPWALQFATRMSAILGDELDAIAKNTTDAVARCQTFTNKALTSIRAQRSRIVEALTHSSDLGGARLDALWWSEALYSPTLRESYRRLPRLMAPIVMALDLAYAMSAPAAASVGYLLAETVGRLPHIEFEESVPLSSVLEGIHRAAGELPEDYTEDLELSSEGRLSLRDLVVLASTASDFDVASSLRRAGFSDDAALSLPDLAHAVFRQEQALHLAGSLEGESA